MSSRIVMVGHQPKEGKETELEQLVLIHHQKLNKEGLVTERQPIIMKSAEGAIIEVFEWLSEAAIEQAHSNTNLHKELVIQRE